GAEFVAEIQARGHRQTDPTADARPHGYVLLAFHGIRDRVADDPRAQFTRPQHLARRSIDGTEVAAEAAVERQSARGDQGTAPVRILVGNFPLGLSGHYIELLELAGHARLLGIHVYVGEYINSSLLGMRTLLRFIFHAPVVGRHIEIG